MTYNLADDLDLRKAEARWEALKQKQSFVDLTEKTVRSGSQNRYVHAIIGAIAMETGNSLDFAKEQYFKRLVNPEIFLKTKEDRLAGKVTYLRSSADLTKEEMSLAIDRFRNWAASEGFYLPEPGDDELIRKIEFEMGRNRQYL